MASIAKYGKENFKREILEWCDSVEELNIREKYWIKQLDAKNPEIGYNISDGGEGNKENGKLNSLYCFVHNDDGFIRILKTDKDVFLKNGYLSGKGPGTNGLVGSKKSDSTRKKISESNRGKHNHFGENNPCFGSHFIWITDGTSNKRLPIGEKIPHGWKKGKVQKKPKHTEKSDIYYNKLRTDRHWQGNKNPMASFPYRWYTNGTQTIRSIDCPEGFYIGMANVGAWYNNGKNEIKIKPGEVVPNNYVKGRLKHAGEISKKRNIK